MTWEECVILRLQNYYKRVALPELRGSLATQEMNPEEKLVYKIVSVILEDKYILSCIEQDYKTSFRAIKKAFDQILKQSNLIAAECEKECNGIG